MCHLSVTSAALLIQGACLFSMIDRTILNSLVIQDYYPATADGSVPVFTLHKSTTTKQAMKDQEELLHIHKMTELARVMFTIEMMKVDTSSSVGLQQEVCV